MKMLPAPRPRIYDLYWYFAYERQAVFENRLRGLPSPWTDDPIISTYKFCNVFRATDRVSQYMIKEVAYGVGPCSPVERLFHIVAFRLFSRPATWESVKRTLGRSPTFQDLASDNFLEAIQIAKQENGGLYTHAFILCANNAYGQPNKHQNHVELLRHMFLKDSLGEELLCVQSLEDVYTALLRYPLIGPFMAYQIAIDLNYSEHINFDENDFTQTGPGALRGISKAFESLGDYTPNEVVQLMVARQDEEFKRLGLDFRGLFGRPLHAIDCQGLFCELDKYTRVAAPELASNRRRIKTKFSPSPEPMPLFFPPKWQLATK